jgi:hypothetical protein
MYALGLSPTNMHIDFYSHLPDATYTTGARSFKARLRMWRKVRRTSHGEFF